LGLPRTIPLVVCLIVRSVSSALGQGLIDFANYRPGTGPPVNAPVTYLDGTRVTLGYTAQLYGGPLGTPTESLQPLFNTTYFFSGAGAGYVSSGNVLIPLPAGSMATVNMRAYNGATWETSQCRGQSLPVTIPVGGIAEPGNPVALHGLQAFSVNCVPEPSALGLGSLGILGLILGARVSRRKRW